MDLYILPAKPLIVNTISESSWLIVNVKLQRICRSANYTLVVFFGVMENRGCYLRNVTADNIVPGEHRIFEVNNTVLKKPNSSVYCYEASLFSDVGIDGNYFTYTCTTQYSSTVCMWMAMAVPVIVYLTPLFNWNVYSVFYRHIHTRKQEQKEKCSLGWCYHRHYLCNHADFLTASGSCSWLCWGMVYMEAWQMSQWPGYTAEAEANTGSYL